MLKSDIEKADHRGWVDARKENITELKNQLSEYQALEQKYVSDRQGCVSELRKLEASESNAPAAQKKEALHELFSRLPEPMDSPNLLSSHGTAIKAAAENIRTEASRLEAEQRSIKSSFELLGSRSSALSQKLDNATTEADFKNLRNEINTLGALLKRHNSDVRSHKRLSGRLISKLSSTQNQTGFRSIIIDICKLL